MPWQETGEWSAISTGPDCNTTTCAWGHKIGVNMIDATYCRLSYASCLKYQGIKAFRMDQIEVYSFATGLLTSVLILMDAFSLGGITS